MKQKAVFSILGITLFALAISFSFSHNQKENLQVKNYKALAKKDMEYPGCCDDIWSVTYSTSGVSCTTGGGYDCVLCCF